MSNLGQFYGKGFPIGGTVSLPNQGDLYTAPDGSVWLGAFPSAPFAYSSTYASVAGISTVNHPLMNGPRDYGWWVPLSAISHLAYKPSGTLTATTALYGDTTNGFTYATSTNDGASWTTRSFPNTKLYETLVFTGGKFVGVSNSSTTNGIITSTDAVTWTSVTGVSATYQDVVSDGTNNFVAIATSGTTAASSTDGGTTWASATVTAFPNVSRPGMGLATWNAGASLFIGGTTTAGQYQTSPTGATWTLRSTQATFLPYSIQFGGACKFASNATTTVVVGNGGFFATTTDGLTWSNHGFMNPNMSGETTTNALYHDGSRFVAVFNNGDVCYSTNGTSWTVVDRSLRLLSGIGIVSISSGVLFTGSTITAARPGKLVRMSDATSTTPQTIIPSTFGAPAGATTYVRIK